MNVLLVLGHPRKDSLGGALHQAFRAGLTAAGKKTFVVTFGKRWAVLAALICTQLATVSALAWHILGRVEGIYGMAVYLVVPHAVLLSWRLVGKGYRKPLPARIDALMALALTFIIWFGAIPLVRLL